MIASLCRHYQTCRANRPKRLCWTCYYTPGVRERYAPLAETIDQQRGSCRGVPDGYGPRPLPAAPTDVPPGTPAKVAVLEARAAEGLTLWHPLDARN